MNNLKELREQLGLTQEELGKAVGRCASSISRYESKGEIPEIIQLWLEHERVFRKTFVLGKKYYIGKDREWSYEYVGDEGIHHVFKASPGGWTQTYTDAQLTGKSIEGGD